MRADAAVEGRPMREPEDAEDADADGETRRGRAERRRWSRRPSRGRAPKRPPRAADADARDRRRGRGDDDGRRPPRLTRLGRARPPAATPAILPDVPDRLPPPGPSFLREQRVRVGERDYRLGMARPTEAPDGWWLAILWVADDDGVIRFRDVAPAAGPPPDPPLARLGPARQPARCPG